MISEIEEWLKILTEKLKQSENVLLFIEGQRPPDYYFQKEF